MTRVLTSTTTLVLYALAVAGPFPIMAAPALAQANMAKPVDKSGEWGIYVAGTGKQKYCYAATSPKERKPDLQRDPAYLYIINRPAENVKNEITIVLGFPAKAGSTAKAEIGSASFDMTPKGKEVWMDNAAKETQMVAALRKGQKLVLKTTSQRGNVTTDTYVLTGLDKALERVAKECQ
jgi:hypothetical protein